MRTRLVWGAGGAALGCALLLGCSSILGFDDFIVGAADGGSGETSVADVSNDVTGVDGGSDASFDKCAVPNKPLVQLTEVAQDTTLDCTNDYLLVNQVYVRAGATLTIPAGTTIKGTRLDASQFDKVSVLVVQPGGKINAVGTAESPIIFTSDKPDAEKKAGDWGGVILLGNAVVNQGVKKIEGVGVAGTDITYGGGDDEDSSGTLKYVRIEYGGFKLSENNEINGLTLGGVGRKTVIDFVQVRYVLDDCFEFFGGTVNASHLACQYGQDDGLDWDFGYRGKIQFVIIQQDPNIYDDMNGIEADNGGNDTDAQKSPVSEPTLYNLTLCGPGKPTPPRPVFPDGGASTLRIRYGLAMRRHTKAHIFNSIITGFEAGFDATAYKSAGVTPDLLDAKGSLELKNVIFWGNTHAKGDPGANVAFAEINGGVGLYADDDQGYDEFAEVITNGTGNREVDPKIGGCFNAKAPSFGPTVEIPSAGITPPADDPFFIPVSYIGAFKDVADPWATGSAWARWDDK